ncbi:MAG: hypothetical protein M5U14_21830 [Acidimicrobiia bacterium]|nr:hypothetical protein [Acidimicrobiia bacterium]
MMEAKAIVVADAELVSVSTLHPLLPALEAPGLSVDIVEPFARLSVRLEALGTVGRDADGFVPCPEHGDTPVGIDVTVSSVVPPVDWQEALAGLPIPGLERDHYELGASFNGVLTVGSRRVEASGLLVRDHTWGVREYTAFPAAWWTPVCFEDAFVTGVSILHGGRWNGLTIVTRDGSTTTVLQHQVDLPEGARLAPGGYQAATVAFPRPEGEPARLETRVVTHLPVRYPGFAPGYVVNDAFSVARWGERTGFGSIELNTTVSPEEMTGAVAAAST